MENKKTVRRLMTAIVFWAVVMMTGITAWAAEMVMTIQSCDIIPSSPGEIEFRAIGPAGVTETDGNYYIFGLLPQAANVDKDAIALGSTAQQSVISMRLPLNVNNSKSVLYRKLVVAVKDQSGNYIVLSNGRFITNPEVLAAYRYSFPKAKSKKGLHIQPDMLADAEDLSVKHAAVNICLDTFVASNNMKNTTSSYPYTYQGKTYWFTKYACEEVDRQVKKLSETKVQISGILLLRNRGAGSVLVPPEAKKQSHAYYGFNVMNRNGTETLAALMSFLGERYMSPSGSSGQIVNWIVGNEVNDYVQYNYMGELAFSEYVKAYANSFRVVSTALHSVYSNARVYISLNHLWQTYQSGRKSFFAKDMLDGFARQLVLDGDIPWNLAFHPYPAPLTDANFWDDNVTNSDATRFVTMKNIGYLTDYMNRHFRSDARVILSEQGFTSQKVGKTSQELQAAAFAYAYYITEFNDKIDAFIMNRHVDHLEETKQNLYLGVWTNQAGALESASTKKVIWNVFKYIDSSSSESVSAFALKYLPGNSWSSLIPGFSFSKFKKMDKYKTGIIQKFKKALKAKRISNALKYEYTGKAVKNGDTTLIYVNPEANRNLYQGAGWVFARPLNLKSKPQFTCRLHIQGMKGKNAHIRIRFFSGKNIYEAEAKVKAKTPQKLRVDLSKWKKRNKIDKIQIWVRPYNKKGWKTGGVIAVSGMQRAKTTK
ncbi:MAG: DUF5722 domain-containing protein [Eubacteriales bacterium]|nr:DUF5722 domain-containing protein [Eubacteriales bacterium]